MRVTFQSIAASRGCSLLEALIATTLVTTAVAALVQLLAVATDANRRARHTTVAAVLAQDKMEQLLPGLASGIGFGESPSGTLLTNVDGFCDFVDAQGNVTAGVAPPNAIYFRRWSIGSSPARPNAVIVQVIVAAAGGRLKLSSAAPPGEARIVGVWTRHGP